MKTSRQFCAPSHAVLLGAALLLTALAACTAPNPLYQPDPCLEASDCEAGQVCYQGECLDVNTECQDDDDCPGDQICDAQQCVDDDDNNDPNNNPNNDPNNQPNNDPNNNPNNDPNNDLPDDCQPPCADGEICVEDGGRFECVEKVCEPGQVRCAEGGTQNCIDGGAAWSETFPCDFDTVCVEGQCIPSQCDPGTTVCRGEVVTVCTDGGQLEPQRDCGQEGLLCQNSQCVEPRCDPGQAFCQGNTAVVCNERGDGIDQERDCAAQGQLCQDGQCIDVDPDCANAVAFAQIEGDPDSVPSERLEVSLDTAVRLDGSQSSLAAGWSWSIINRPDGSQTSIRRAQNPIALFAPDVPGTYVIELRVFGFDDEPGCTTAQITIAAGQQDRQGLSIEINWATPNDPNPNDGMGGDLDLHLLHANADAWNTQPWDCYWQNTSPNWGGPSNNDDPLLVLDSGSGGPERIEILRPERITYRAGVHYFADNDYGPSLLSLIVYVDNVQIYRSPGRQLNEPGVFWDAVFIRWRGNEAEVEPIDVITEAFPEVD